MARVRLGFRGRSRDPGPPGERLPRRPVRSCSGAKNWFQKWRGVRRSRIACGLPAGRGGGGAGGWAPDYQTCGDPGLAQRAAASPGASRERIPALERVPTGSSSRDPLPLASSPPTTNATFETSSKPGVGRRCRSCPSHARFPAVELRVVPISEILEEIIGATNKVRRRRGRHLAENAPLTRCLGQRRLHRRREAVLLGLPSHCLRDRFAWRVAVVEDVTRLLQVRALLCQLP